MNGDSSRGRRGKPLSLRQLNDGVFARQGLSSGRLEGGVGFVLSDPTTCEYSVSPATAATSYRGACEASAVPAMIIDDAFLAQARAPLK